MTKVVYFDSAATSLKLISALSASIGFYRDFNSNVHRSSNFIATKATELFEEARKKIQNVIDPLKQGLVLFTQNTTESINLAAYIVEQIGLRQSDTILLTEFEHHSNLLPWLRLAKKVGCGIKFIRCGSCREEFVQKALEDINSLKPRILAVSHVSNTLGLHVPVEKLAGEAKKFGAFVFIDGAQAVPHLRPKLENVDFYAFSSHKVFGPFGVGVLWVRHGLVDEHEPLKIGGGTITDVSFEDYHLADVPYRFEAGTQPIAEIIGLSVALSWLNEHLDQWQQKEERLRQKFLEGLGKFEDNFKVLWKNPDIPLFSLYSDRLDLAGLNFILSSRGICVRLGHHCAIPIHRRFGITQSLRVSLAAYNDETEIDYFFESLSNALSTEKHVVLLFNDNSQGLAHKAIDITEQLVALSDEELVHYLIDLSATNPIPDNSFLNEGNLVKGCMSKVYVWRDTKAPFFNAWSESPTLNGLVTLLRNMCSGCSSQEILDFNFLAFLDAVNIFKALSTNRRFGVANLIDRIKEVVRKHESRN
ncbi:MAG: aminotransferase class V-fold PLP-dependent enzyme [Deltaproteobacteria bacterium]|nr:aminotransferase class V-fold PLP-dependent enzyme [Deltaproteobacteria bacterium]